MYNSSHANKTNWVKDMAKTRHFHKRMGQRGVTQCMVDLVCKYGVEIGDKKMLDRRNIDELLQGVDVFRKKLINLRDKGGIVIIEVDDALITAYRPDSYSRKCVAS